MEEKAESSHLIKNFDEIAISPRRKGALEVLEGAMSALSPQSVIEKRGNELFSEFATENVHVFGFGKAASGMLEGVRKTLKKGITEATIIIPEDERAPAESPDLLVLRGTHPITSRLSEESGRKLISILDRVPAGDPILFLISGGGSALFEVPENGFSIDDIANVSKCMMENGSDINDLNCVRYAMSMVKGGKLALHTEGRNVLALYISDVPKDDISVISSGPLVPSRSDCDPSMVIGKYPCSALLRGRALRKAATLPSGKVRNELILSNYDFVSEISRRFRHEGRHVIDLGSDLKGDVAEYASSIIQVLRSANRITGGGFWFAGGGEPTVNVRGNGRGGRCQELALRFVREMEMEESFLFLTAGTDGIDGNTDAMGAVVDSSTRSGIDNDTADRYLENSDSHSLLMQHNSVIFSGRTGNNVSDIFLGYYAGKKEKSEERT